MQTLWRPRSGQVWLASARKHPLTTCHHLPSTPWPWKWSGWIAPQSFFPNLIWRVDCCMLVDLVMKRFGQNQSKTNNNKKTSSRHGILPSKIWPLLMSLELPLTPVSSYIHVPYWWYPRRTPPHWWFIVVWVLGRELPIIGYIFFIIVGSHKVCCRSSLHHMPLSQTSLPDLLRSSLHVCGNEGVHWWVRTPCEEKTVHNHGWWIGHSTFWKEVQLCWKMH